MRTLAEKQKLFIDFCGGIDHAVALWYALQAPDVEVVGVGCSDTEMERGSSLAKKLIGLALPDSEIPVAAGGSQSLFGRPEKGQAAARLLVEKANEYKGELTVVTLGRLTNLATAVAIDPRIAEKLERVVVQGGAIRVPGNATAVAESNFHADPEAAAFVWAAGLPLQLVPFDATDDLRLTLEDSQAIFRKAVTLGITQASMEKDQPSLEDGTRLDAWSTMIAVMHPEHIHKQQMKLTIECHSPLSRGAVLADLRAKPSVGIDTEVVIGIDVEPFRQWLQGISVKEGSL
ncbi:nucleoside hydrolase [Brevibacillus choshinensis]|uniref:nucleoside hydrolase n=1 Tax=Brevibacillus choshinensis TaxID=54911 RepID=UPI002E22AFD7|nr:nucleoside hydrolase [Brevibacillus choshinensis]MED4584981.1 nucleoside hydrolase [Brevibacillus choshinensis]